ncbi:MAG: riboflavin synthase [Desulfuromonadales bacterium]|nr:riboflavin synthase [Desulfuromonadales bacterium]
MFTGLIEDLGNVLKIERKGGNGTILISTKLNLSDSKLGDSIAVNGACLTIKWINGSEILFDVSEETFKRTGFSKMAVASPVNVERSLRLSDRLDGHIITGHVDFTANVTEIKEKSSHKEFTFSIPEGYSKYVVEKGSIAVDGISLTVNAATRNSFKVNIIPATLSKTTLANSQVGDSVNIETDIIGKYVERLLNSGKAGSEKISFEMLASNGFI